MVSLLLWWALQLFTRVWAFPTQYMDWSKRHLWKNEPSLGPVAQRLRFSTLAKLQSMGSTQKWSPRAGGTIWCPKCLQESPLKSSWPYLKGFGCRNFLKLKDPPFWYKGPPYNRPMIALTLKNPSVSQRHLRSFWSKNERLPKTFVKKWAQSGSCCSKIKIFHLGQTSKYGVHPKVKPKGWGHNMMSQMSPRVSPEELMAISQRVWLQEFSKVEGSPFLVQGTPL